MATAACGVAPAGIVALLERPVNRPSNSSGSGTVDLALFDAQDDSFDYAIEAKKVRHDVADAVALSAHDIHASAVGEIPSARQNGIAGFYVGACFGLVSSAGPRGGLPAAELPANFDVGLWAALQQSRGSALAVLSVRTEALRQWSPLPDSQAAKMGHFAHAIVIYLAIESA